MVKIENVIRHILGIAGCMAISLGTCFVADDMILGWIGIVAGAVCVMLLVPPTKQDKN